MVTKYTVRALIGALQALSDKDKDRLVILSRDEEGNGFGYLQDIDLSTYDGDSTFIESLTPELKKAGYTEEDLCEDGEPVLVLWP